MTPEAQQIAIVKACPLIAEIDRDNGGCFWKKPDPFVIFDPLNDLNAIHEAENQLSNLEHQQFCLFLHKSIMGTMDDFDINGTCNLECVSRVVKATAAQRAEAFLRAKGLWTDEPATAGSAAV